MPAEPVLADKIQLLAHQLASLLAENKERINQLCQEADSIQDKLHSIKGPANRQDQTTSTSPLSPDNLSVLNLQQQGDGKELDELKSRCLALQTENSDLNQTLEIVMSKYRLQAQSINEERQKVRKELESVVEEERRINETLRAENASLQQKLIETLKVMQDAALAEDEESEQDVQLLQSLISENEGLKQMLSISSQP